jgi:hypothetical protein
MGLEFLLFWTMMKLWFSTMCLIFLQSKFSQAILQSTVSGITLFSWFYVPFEKNETYVIRSLKCFKIPDALVHYLLNFFWPTAVTSPLLLLEVCNLLNGMMNYVIIECSSWSWWIWDSVWNGFDGVFREDTESGDGETRDSFSDSWSNESVTDKVCRSDGCSSEEGGSEQDNPWPINDRLGRLYFEYFERSTPYGRVPLMDKVSVFFFFFCFCADLTACCLFQSNVLYFD